MASSLPGSNPHASLTRALSVASLVPNAPLPAPAHLEGFVVSTTPYNTQTKLFALDLSSTHPNDASLKVQVQLKGAEWAQQAAGLFGSKIGQRVVLSGPAGVTEVRKVPKAKEGEVPISQRLRIVFTRGVEGAWRDEDGKRVDSFRFMGPAVKKRKRSSGFSLPSASPPDALPHAPPVASNSATAKLRKPHATPHPHSAAPAATLPTPASLARLEVPRANPSNPYVGVGAGGGTAYPGDADVFATSGQRGSVAAPTPALFRQREKAESTVLTPAPTSEGESPSPPEPSARAVAQPETAEDAIDVGHEPEKKKRKRERRDDLRTSWGLTTAKRQYLALDSLPERNGPGHNVIAMAVVIEQPRPCGKQNDWKAVYRLYDPTNAADGVPVNYFSDRGEAGLPKIEDGDIVVVQSLNWSKDKKLFTAYKEKGHYVVLPMAQLLSPCSTFTAPKIRGASFDDDEVAYCRDLARWAKKHDLLGNATGTVGDVLAKQDEAAKAKRELLARRRSGGRPLVRVEEMCEDQFCDTYGEVVRYYNPLTINPHSVPSNAACDLYITDYTSHPDIVDVDTSRELNLTGQRLLKVAIFGAQNEPLVNFSRDKLVGSIVRLRNLRPKLDSNGGFECTMVEDFKYKDNRDVMYWEKDPVARLAPAFTVDDTSTAELKPADPPSEICDLSGFAAPQPLSGAVALNSPGIFRIRVQVVDFSPDRLDDWVIAFCPACGEELTSSMTACFDCDQIGFEWSFRLALVDANEPNEPPILLDVSGQQTDTLFPSFSPADFASVRDGHLEPLNKRLRGILGDLESQKRRKQPLREENEGPGWDVVLEGIKGESGKLSWRFAEGRVVFR
ncbi:hypothetical protein JCM10213v2_008874 [Rhodosporidiobolus nylandii]